MVVTSEGGDTERLDILLLDRPQIVVRRRAMRNPLGTDFGKLWTALSISLIGSEITKLARPLIAASTLGASAFERGVLAGVGQAPFLLFTALFVFAAGMVISPLLGLASPLRSLRAQPTDVDDEQPLVEAEYV